MNESVTIMFPVAVMVLLTAVVAFRYLFFRICCERVRASDPAKCEALDATAKQAMNHVSNCFEMPVFFYVLCAALFATDSADPFYINSAWIYVAFRIAHAFIHVTYNNIMHRLAAFTLANITMWIMWGRFVVQAL